MASSPSSRWVGGGRAACTGAAGGATGGGGAVVSGASGAALAGAGIDPAVELAPFRPVTAAYDAARRLLERPDRPTGLLCFSDVYAAQAMRAAESLGLRVPQDVSVVGFDDSSLATAVHPTLTTVSQPVSDKGRLAVAALLDSMGATGPDPARTVLPTSLVVRESTAPPPSDS